MAMTDVQRVNILEEKGFNYFEIADILDMRYETVRALSERDD